MHQCFKIISFVHVIILLFSCQYNRQYGHRKDAANLVNSIDSLTDNLGPAGMNLVKYFNKVNAIAKTKTNYQLEDYQIDSLKYYYSILIFNYDDALNISTTYKNFEDGDSLKSNFLTLIKTGKEAWVTIIPTHLRVYKEGLKSASQSELNIMNSTTLIFANSAKATLKWSKIVGDQEDEFILKYNLKYSNSTYR